MLDSMDNVHGLNNLGAGWQTNTSSLGYSNGVYQAAFSSNSTFGVINQFKFLAARSIRTSTIILAVFNTVSAFATAAGIFYDCYTSAKRSNPEGKGRVNVFRCIRGPETYPFILSLGITIQGIVFAVAQSRGLDGLFIPGCSLISQFMWPAIFIVPYIQLVFGLEVALRAIRSMPFLPRSKWNVPICLAIVKMLLLITGLVGFFIQPPTFCFASLFWFVAKWAEGGFVLLLMIVIILTICSIVIFLKLTRYAMIEDSERVSASRMVYYLVLAVVTNALIMPFFLYLTFSHPLEDNGTTGLTLSMISTVVANVTGLTTGGLHLFLRSRTISTIGPKNKLVEYERQKLKHQIRVRGTNDMDFNGHMLQPVSGPEFSKTESQENLVGEKGDAAERGETSYLMDPFEFNPTTPNPLRSNAVFEAANISPVPETIPIPPTPTANIHSRKQSASYTLFPSKNQSNTTSVALLSSTSYNPNPQSTLGPTSSPSEDWNDSLRPPPPVWARHKRDSSIASSATVQIGLRISNVADIGPVGGKSSAEAERAYALNYPQNEAIAGTYRPSPLASFNTSNAALPPSPNESRGILMKDLPPANVRPGGEGSDFTLNPTVYDPKSPTKSKVPSPRGVGFNVPRRANTTPVQGTSTPPPTTRNRGNSSGVADSRTDWI
ncbi:hypothetical protein F4804DRAFT_227935 [Jackrogersella minutella]|nr:hypothetical protein F4804DRAFT_227935 [Jackrogersella minutella]